MMRSSMSSLCSTRSTLTGSTPCFAFNPTALDGILRKHDHDLIENANGVFDAFLKTVADFQIFWREPAAKILCSKISGLAQPYGYRCDHGRGAWPTDQGGKN